MKSMLTKVLLALLCLSFAAVPVCAADGETLYNGEYCFREEDFGEEPELSGVFVTGVPGDEVARIRLGNRTIRSGDILTVEALDQLRLLPACKDSCDAVMTFRPIVGRALAEPAQVTIRIQSGKNETPTAVAGELETYKNIPNNGTLSAKDPENSSLTYQLVDKPKRGTVELKEDGTYLYTPDKNKVGEDSFTFTATDDAGNVSKPEAIRIRILKPSDAMTFADLEGSDAQFEAMWMTEQKLNSGRSIGDYRCFFPEETVSRSEFLIMAMHLMEINTDEKLTVSGFMDTEKAWYQPYLATAMRHGLIRGEVSEAGLVFRPQDPITGQEAAVILQNMLKLPAPVSMTDSELPVWSAGAVQALAQEGITVTAEDRPLTRIEAAELLYQVSKLR